MFPRFIGLAIVCVVAALLSVCLGSECIPVSELWNYFFSKDPINSVHAGIIEFIRIPRTFTAIIAGASLAVAGLIMQTLFRNALADPFVLGINSGASLGVAILVLLLGVSGVEWMEGFGVKSGLSMVASSACGATVVLVVVFFLSRYVDMMTLLIIGLIIGYATSALVSVLMFLSLPERLQTFLNWSFGNFGNVDWRDARTFSAVCLMGVVLAVLAAKPLNALLLGETYAKSLGVNVRLLRWQLIVSSALLAGAVTAYCGPIGFIGVAVPHLCRSYLRSIDHRLLIPTCMVTGSIVALVADIIARVPGTDLTLPLNAVTALIGAPVVLFVLLKRRNIQSEFTK